ncbi:AzlD domain-containing protein [Staphylococcus pseudintermedius]|uniref:AzlD domain-containing protein n=1 Tax=Staphylococcus pseudintermedius TaxID=283734 RepID=UPI001F544727|nr:AzlD domain-containing protein [Staphylococcus pseudintermedius]
MYVFWTIFLAGLGTLLIRITPFVMISRMELSDKVLKWLTFNDNSHCRYGECGTVENYRIILTIICIRDRFAV